MARFQFSRRISVAAAMTCASGLLGSPAQASCVPASLRDDMGRADAVFVGRVLSVSESGGSARFRVLRVAKGNLAPRAAVRVFARPFPSSVTLNWSPKPGERWRVYIQRKAGRWVTHDCQGTRRSQD